MKIFLNILKTIIAVPLVIVGAILLTPLYLLCLLIELPVLVITDIWED